MILPSQSRAATVAISRYGRDSAIIEPVDDDSVTDNYGKMSEDSWNTVATEPVVRIYTDGSAPQQARVEGGRYRTDSPKLLFISDSAVAEGDRVSYQSTLYEIDSLTAYPTHYEAQTTVVN